MLNFVCEDPRTFLRCCENVQCLGGEQHQRRRKLVAKQPELSHRRSVIAKAQGKSLERMRNTYMHGIVLVKILNLLDLAHHDDNGRDAIEDGIARSLVGLPGIDEMADSLLEELAIDLDCVRHDGDSSTETSS